MSFGKILGRAWEITWRWKVLWVLGFLVSLSQTWSQIGNRSDWVERRGGYMPPEIGGALLALACLAVLIGIALWVLSVIARGALIGGVQQVEQEGATSLGQAWRAGVSRFWTLFGIGILTSLPTLLMVFVIVAAFVGPLVADVAISGHDEPRAGIALSLLCGTPLCCLTIAGAIVLTQLQKYADRAAVLEGLGWIEAIKRGWQVLKENLAPTVMLWLIFLGIGLVLFFVIGGGIFVLSLPFLGILMSSEPEGWLLIPLVCGGLLTVVIGALIGSVVETFTSATWTLAYREMTGPTGQTTELEATA
ncbi:MAG: DUF7544 domain-containing protein [Chloroflexota bacterium]